MTPVPAACDRLFPSTRLPGHGAGPPVYPRISLTEKAFRRPAARRWRQLGQLCREKRPLRKRTYCELEQTMYIMPVFGEGVLPQSGGADAGRTRIVE